ncbi:hypothetical protein [Rhizohabitans arisaemae]|uniref:hypothetical protein n=1 Tax=Rhizohabitans arisaemae TaxID=2720610 RepID=UPI0024B0C17E|nr:hypothetical protein [Rhizohabitans arisaemae]
MKPISGEHFALTPPSDETAINEAAFAAYGRPFAQWWLRMYPDHVSMTEMLKEPASRWS